ncbi:MAG: PfkB family carbohydrate kinase, partial [Candidatus Omnitrophica bacterium]|nr:PfkB family carbohydrate kinase [Candidatus Omnitrophota bacterium]
DIIGGFIYDYVTTAEFLYMMLVEQGYMQRDQFHHIAGTGHAGGVFDDPRWSDVHERYESYERISLRTWAFWIDTHYLSGRDYSLTVEGDKFRVHYHDFRYPRQPVNTYQEWLSKREIYLYLLDEAGRRGDGGAKQASDSPIAEWFKTARNAAGATESGVEAAMSGLMDAAKQKNHKALEYLADLLRSPKVAVSVRCGAAQALVFINRTAAWNTLVRHTKRSLENITQDPGKFAERKQIVLAVFDALVKTGNYQSFADYLSYFYFFGPDDQIRARARETLDIVAQEEFALARDEIDILIEMVKFTLDKEVLQEVLTRLARSHDPRARKVVKLYAGSLDSDLRKTARRLLFKKDGGRKAALERVYQSLDKGNIFLADQALVWFIFGRNTNAGMIDPWERSNLAWPRNVYEQYLRLCEMEERMIRTILAPGTILLGNAADKPLKSYLLPHEYWHRVYLSLPAGLRMEFDRAWAALPYGWKNGIVHGLWQGGYAEQEHSNEFWAMVLAELSALKAKEFSYYSPAIKEITGIPAVNRILSDYRLLELHTKALSEGVSITMLPSARADGGSKHAESMLQAWINEKLNRPREAPVDPGTLLELEKYFLSLSAPDKNKFTSAVWRTVSPVGLADSAQPVRPARNHENKIPHILAVAQPVLDIFVTYEQAHNGLAVASIREYVGGNATNVSKAFLNFGGKADLLYFRSPGRLGVELDALLKPYRFIGTEPVPVRGGRINVYFMAEGKEIRLISSGGEISLKAGDTLIGKLGVIAPRLPAGSLLVMGNRIPPGLCDDFYSRIITCARQRGVRTCLDFSQSFTRAQINRIIDAKPFFIKANLAEFAHLAQIPVERLQDDPLQMIEAARVVTDQGVSIFVISLGDKGALLVTPDEAFYALAPRVPVISTIGAGDTLIAGLAYRLFGHDIVTGHILKESLRFGVAASAATCLKPGTDVADLDEAKALVGGVQIVTERVLGDLCRADGGAEDGDNELLTGLLAMKHIGVAEEIIHGSKEINAEFEEFMFAFIQMPGDERREELMRFLNQRIPAYARRALQVKPWVRIMAVDARNKRYFYLFDLITEERSMGEVTDEVADGIERGCYTRRDRNFAQETMTIEQLLAALETFKILRQIRADGGKDRRDPMYKRPWDSRIIFMSEDVCSGSGIEDVNGRLFYDPEFQYFLDVVSEILRGRGLQLILPPLGWGTRAVVLVACDWRAKCRIVAIKIAHPYESSLEYHWQYCKGMQLLFERLNEKGYFRGGMFVEHPLVDLYEIGIITSRELQETAVKEVPCYPACIDFDLAYQVMEYIDCGRDNLATLLAKGYFKDVPLIETIDLVCAFAVGMDRLHSKGIWHGELAMRNIVLQEGIRLRGCDIDLSYSDKLSNGIQRDIVAVYDAVRAIIEQSAEDTRYSCCIQAFFSEWNRKHVEASGLGAFAASLAAIGDISLSDGGEENASRIVDIATILARAGESTENIGPMLESMEMALSDAPVIADEASRDELVELLKGLAAHVSGLDEDNRQRLMIRLIAQGLYGHSFYNVMTVLESNSNRVLIGVIAEFKEALEEYENDRFNNEIDDYPVTYECDLDAFIMDIVDTGIPEAVFAIDNFIVLGQMAGMDWESMNAVLYFMSMAGRKKKVFLYLAQEENAAKYARVMKVLCEEGAETGAAFWSGLQDRHECDVFEPYLDPGVIEEAFAIITNEEQRSPGLIVHAKDIWARTRGEARIDRILMLAGLRNYEPEFFMEDPEDEEFYDFDGGEELSPQGKKFSAKIRGLSPIARIQAYYLEAERRKTFDNVSFMIAVFLKFLDLDTDRPMTVIHIGCGKAALLKKMTAEYPLITGIGVDCSGAQLRTAVRGNNSGRSMHIIKGVDGAIGIRDHCADIMIVETVEHMVKAEASVRFREWIRILKQGGTLILNVTDASDPTIRRCMLDPARLVGVPIEYWKETDVLEAASRNGFELIGKKKYPVAWEGKKYPHIFYKFGMNAACKDGGYIRYGGTLHDREDAVIVHELGYGMTAAHCPFPFIKTYNLCQCPALLLLDPEKHILQLAHFDGLTTVSSSLDRMITELVSGY